MEVGYGIEKWNPDTDTWDLIGSAFVGLPLWTAKREISQLREWAKADESGAKYRRVKTAVTPI